MAVVLCAGYVSIVIRGCVVGSKELSVRQGLTVSKVDQWISHAIEGGERSNNRSNGGDSNESTIDEMLRHSQVKKHGTFGRLSASQQNLITSVVSVMQDKVAGDAKQNAETLKDIILAEREALKAMSHSFTSTAKSLYQLPLIGSLKKTDDIKDVTSEGFSNARYDEEIIGGEKNDSAQGAPDSGKQHSWVHFFSWGNMISIAAIVLLVLVVKTSVETANFETQYHNAIAEVDTLELSLEAKEKKYEGLLSELQLANVKIAGLESNIDGLKHNAEQKQAMLEATIQKQDNQVRKLQLLSSSAQTTLKAEIKALQTEVAQFKGKEMDGDQQNAIWKQLAKERKEELNQLQSQILALSELSRKDASAEEDSGWSLF